MYKEDIYMLQSIESFIEDLKQINLQKSIGLHIESKEE